MLENIVIFSSKIDRIYMGTKIELFKIFDAIGEFMGVVLSTAGVVVSDSINYAYQLGRLDFVSLLLVGITVILIIAGAYTFFDVRKTAVKTASKVAKEEVAKIAEETVNAYMQTNFPKMLDAFKELELAEDNIADELAEISYEEE